ncbi:hypothetical protein KP509_26G024400 [Ceratopteris richardii]|uniref:CRAL-TRIO domain-containing protein n=1 Tax=Ceratopteris richardii TaxID=49495 RepID=A0A8T2RLB2_CERRI|nr:hypothetical protein KP509_26G024400 [Ceratopteris richardii]
MRGSFSFAVNSEQSENQGPMDENTQEDQFLDLDELQFLSTEGIDRCGRRILRIVAKFVPAPVIDRSRLQDYVLYKLFTEVPQEPFCIIYFHAQAKWSENCPGIFNLRSIYEAIPQDFRQRLEAIYVVHPGAFSRMILATFGRLLSDGLYDKVKYISRLEFLWYDVRMGQVEVPEFVCKHDNLLEERPLMDYWIETDPFGTLSSSAINHCSLSEYSTVM